MSADLHFIALIPPEELQERVQHIKYHFRDKYNSSHSLNAPPHITLLSPFRLEEGMKKDLYSILNELANQLSPFDVELRNFDVFEPRVIFIDVVQSEELSTAQSAIEKEARNHTEIFNYNYDDRPYHPHLTLAFKDLTKKNFYAAREKFRDKKFEAAFTAASFFLLKHNGTKWEVSREFNFTV